MSWLYRNLLRPVLFTQDSEKIHDCTLAALGTASRSSFLRQTAEKWFGSEPLPVETFGLRFPNPIGLAAGMDKRAVAVPIWEKCGFGFCELGGVTWLAQEGNPKPRMFRAEAHEALINRMGFNNPGAVALALKLVEWKRLGLWPQHPVGINLGKSKATPLDRAAEDYSNSFQALRGLADFFVVNVSSPNTPGLRQLQDKEALNEILIAIEQHNRKEPRPVLIKVAPDLTLTALDEILDLAQARSLAGIVIGNTTLARPMTAVRKSAAAFSQTGGLSGRPLRELSVALIRHAFIQTRGRLPIVGVGGIFDADDALAKIFAGATLVQIYTGLVFEGPSVVRKIVKGVRDRLKQEGFTCWSDVVGSAAR